MNPASGEGRRIESDDTYATRIPSTATFEELDQVASASVESFSEELADQVAVLLLPDRGEFERSLVAYGLIDSDALARFQASFPEGQAPRESRVLARALVEASLLTRYQASAILQGKAKVLAIGPYLVLDRLGSGGMGLVFLAKHRGSPEVVALKLLPPSASKQEPTVLRFRREANIMAQLNHENLVSFRDVGEHGGIHYLVMDHVEGRDLHRLVRSEGPMSVRQSVDCIIQAARGMAAAHERGIVHRDIKPANLMVDSGGIVRVLDLGLARITRASDPLQSNDPDPSLTHRGMIMGTVDFLPPEQSNDSKLADHRSDIYSLGCTFYYLLTGRPPYSGETIMERLIAHHQQPVPSLRDLRPDVPRRLDAAFRRMVEKDPARRPQSMDEVIGSLEEALSDDPVPGPEHPPVLAEGRRPLDRNPDLSNLSGYEIVSDSRSRIWTPLLVAPSPEVEGELIPPTVSRAEPRARSKPVARPIGPEPSMQRFLVGLLIFLALLALTGILTTLYLIQFVHWSSG